MFSCVPQTETDSPVFSRSTSSRSCSNFFVTGLFRIKHARVAELADAPDLGSGGEILRGSSPLPGTKIIPQSNIELTGIWDMEFDTGDPAANYDNGILSDLEVLAIKRFKNGFGIGFVESWIQQITDDGGSVPAGLHGFRGRAFGIGPIITY